ncbi:MAG: mannitol dehydrogenase family protein [Acidobacteria bacterium]|nr:mannitol dehydrogenase family protein [Acidobacteriota bacterium]
MPRAPIRIVHLGLGAFHRAHQAWYTAHAPDAADWGIAAFTGRSPDLATALSRQDGLYTLVERGPDGDRDELIESVVAAIDGADTGRLLALLEDPAVAVVTLTVTEAGYRLDADGAPDPDDPELAVDLATLRTGFAAGPLERLAPTTTLGRLLLGLEARRRRAAGPIALVSCDNLPGNGGLLRRGVTEAAASLPGALAAFVADSVRFVSTSVDRITPRTTSADVVALNARAARRDDVPVFTEPFADWVLSGDFPAGRPRWEDAGARFVADIEPWEHRKLWLLNGAHTLLSFTGPPRGHATVAEAIGDPELRNAVEGFWDEAAPHLPSALDLPAYRAALLDRFDNPRIEHRLAQIAQDGTRKLRLRIVPVAEAELASGRAAAACAVPVAGWVAQQHPDATERLAEHLRELSPVLADDEGFRGLVASLISHRPRTPLP